MDTTKKARPGMGRLKDLSAVFLLGAFSSMFAGCMTLSQQSYGDDLTKRIKQAGIIVVGHRIGDQKVLKRKGTSARREELREFHFQVEDVLKGRLDGKKIRVHAWQAGGETVYAVRIVPPEGTRVALFLKPMRGFYRQLGRYCHQERVISDIRKHLIQHGY